jgi:hypothetical protein
MFASYIVVVKAGTVMFTFLGRTYSRPMRLRATTMAALLISSMATPTNNPTCVGQLMPKATYTKGQKAHDVVLSKKLHLLLMRMRMMRMLQLVTQQVSPSIRAQRHINSDCRCFRICDVRI